MILPPRVIRLSGLIVAISFLVAGFTLYSLYNTVLQQTRHRLTDIVQSQARLIEAISDSDQTTQGLQKEEHASNVLNQIGSAYADHKGFGDTGEFGLAREVDGRIVFLLSHSHASTELPEPVSMQSALAEPMRAALRGDSLSFIGLDHRGNRVLASTASVKDMGWGLVAKIDLSEVRRPFLISGGMALILTLVLTVVGVMLLLRTTNPMVDRLRRSEQRFRALFEQSGGYCMILDPNTADGIPIIVDANQAACEIHGYTKDELIGRPVSDIDDDAGKQQARENTAQIMTGQPFYINNTHVRKDGTSFPVAVAAKRIDIEGCPPMIYTTEYDITQLTKTESNLLDSEQRFRAIFNQAAVGIARLGIDGRWLEVNDKLCEILGYSRLELLDTTFQEITYAEDLAKDLNLLQETLAGKRDTYSMEKRYITQSGGLTWIRLTVSLARADDLSPLYIISVIEDINERKKADEKLQEAAAVFRNTGEGVTITDKKGTILEVNEAFTRITGYSREEMVGQNPRLLNSGRHDEAFYRDMWNQLSEKGQWRGEIWNRTKSGTVYPEMLRISQVTSETGELTGYVGVFADISSLKDSEARLHHMAHHDPLTDLPNRLLFRDRLNHSLQRSKRFKTMVAVVFFDIDRFKNINDTLGHGVGDELLLLVAQRLQAITREDDTIARISGDEFCMILEDLHKQEEVLPVIDKIISIFFDSFVIESHTVRMSASLGVSLYPDDSRNADDLLSFADAAMYEAKEAGRNTYKFYTKAMTEQAIDHSFVQSALQDALDKSEFFLVYQPQINLRTNTLVGLEALVRWQHPERGLISPASFIPIAEKSGLIRGLGAWVLRTACIQGQQWLKEHRDVGRIYVNVAGPQLQDVSFPEMVRKCLEDTHFPAEKLGLEVTEGFVMQASEHAIDILTELRDLGIELAIDDFGTGYSSLSYLKKLPVRKLKIDQSFVRDIPVDQNDMAIAEAVIALGKAMQMKVIAEGVEEVGQAEFLLSKGCEEAQGYLFSKPLKPAELEEWLEHNKGGQGTA